MLHSTYTQENICRTLKKCSTTFYNILSFIDAVLRLVARMYSLFPFYFIGFNIIPFLYNRIWISNLWLQQSSTSSWSLQVYKSKREMCYWSWKIDCFQLWCSITATIILTSLLHITCERLLLFLAFHPLVLFTYFSKCAHNFSYSFCIKKICNRKHNRKSEYHWKTNEQDS